MDCKEGMLLMKQQGLRAQWLITDPPYGIGASNMNYATQGNVRNGKAFTRDYRGHETWDNQRIGKDIFDLMFELSDNQIVFGGNYYTDILPPHKKLDSVE